MSRGLFAFLLCVLFSFSAWAELELFTETGPGSVGVLRTKFNANTVLTNTNTVDIAANAVAVAELRDDVAALYLLLEQLGTNVVADAPEPDPEPVVAGGSFPDLNVVEPTAVYPSAFSAFDPPVTNVSSSPMIAEWTRAGDEDETVVYASEESITNFAVYADTTNNMTPVVDSGYGRVAMPEDGMKLLWPMAGGVTGTPIRVGNTLAWWLGPDWVTTSDQFSIYGQNLAPDGDTYAYVEEVDLWITNTLGDDYKATFEVPDGLANGVYTVWAHNGQGEKYGWGEPHTLTVGTAIDYSQNTYNVTASSYSDLITKLYAALPNSTINVPGTFEIDTDITGYLWEYPSRDHIASNVWIKGTGSTVFTPSAGYSADAYGNDCLLDFGSDYSGEKYEVHGLKISGITFKPRQGLSMDHLVLMNGYNATLEDCSFDYSDLTSAAPLSTAFTVFGNEGEPMFVRNVTTIANDAVGVGSYTQYHSNTNYGIFDLPGKLIQPSGHNSDISYSFGGHYDDSDVDTSSQGRYVVVSSATCYHSHIGNNTTEDFKPVVGTGNMNSGEQILFENTVPRFAGAVEGATSNTLSASIFSTDSVEGTVVTILDGPGFGQTRPIVAFNGGTATLSENWTVEPTTDSDFVYHKSGWRMTVVSNYLDGIDNGLNTASAAVNLYGGPSEIVVAGNTAHEIEDGFKVFVKADAMLGGTDYVMPAYFNRFEDNVVQNAVVNGGAAESGLGFTISTTGADSQYTPAKGCFGTIFRNNSMANVNYAFGISDGESSFDLVMNVFEGNTGAATNLWSGDQGIGTYTNNNSVAVY